MKNLIILGVFLLQVTSAISQSADSLSPRLLDEIVFEAVQTEDDTLQNFYRSNAPATTESILARMKGFALIRRSAFGQEPVFRSLSGGQVNVTIDGMKIFGACTDKMDPATIYVEPQNLKVLHFLQGTEGSAFGSTFGGTLDMKTAEPILGPAGIKGGAGLDYHSVANTFNYFSLAGFSLRKSAYRVSTTYRKSDDYHSGSGNIVKHSRYEKLNVAGAAKYTLGPYDTLQANVIYDEGWNIGFPALTMDVGSATASILSLTYRRVAPFLIFHNAQTKVYHNRIRHIMDDTGRENVLMHMAMPGRTTTSGILAEADVHVFHKQRTFAKVEHFISASLGEMTMYPEGAPPMYMQTSPKNIRQSTGLFISQYFRLDDRNKLSVSFRGDVVRDNLQPGVGRDQWNVFAPGKSPTSTRFAKTLSMRFDHKLAANIRLEMQAGHGERVPSVNELLGYYLFNRFDGFDYLGNPLLQKESSWNAETTVSYFGGMFELQLTPFYQTITNFIFGDVGNVGFMTPGARGVKQYTNESQANLSGFDMMILARPVSAFQFISTFKYTRGRMADGQSMPLIPPLKNVTSLRYENGLFNMQLEWEWAAAQQHVNTVSMEESTPGWSVLTMRTGWTFNSFIQCNTGVENLFDTMYREHLDWGGIPRPGRNIYLNVLYKFGKKNEK